MNPDKGYIHDSQRRSEQTGKLISCLKAVAGIFKARYGLVCFILLLAITGPGTLYGAKPDIRIDKTQSDLLIPDKELRGLIERLQRALTALDLYDGPYSGVVNDDTSTAILAYQRQRGLERTGIVTKGLVDHIETVVNVGALLERLSIARQVSTKAARQALLDNPSTRDLLVRDVNQESANATHDPKLCFSEPTVRCLLVEALENAKTINRSEMRNWAYGEILIAQAKVGMTAAARDTIRRIRDPRLIIAALGEIAQAQAISGNHDNALAAAEIIPDLEERTSAYSIIADILAKQGNREGALSAVERLHSDVVLMKTDIKRAALMARSSVILANIGYQDRSHSLLKDLEEQAILTVEPSKHNALLRYIASAWASIGNLDKALSLLENVSNDSDKMPVLMRTAEAQILAGNIAAAKHTAHSIAALRYRAVILSTIGIELARAGFESDAIGTLGDALVAREGIKFPFARDYASSRIALAYGQIAYTDNQSNPEIFNRAISSVDEIVDQQLRAKTYWMLAFYRLDAGDSMAEKTKDDAISATGNIESTTSQAWLLADLAEARAKAGDTSWARELYENSLDITQSITSSWGRARVLAKLSQALMALARMSQVKMSPTTSQ